MPFCCKPGVWRGHFEGPRLAMLALGEVCGGYFNRGVCWVSHGNSLAAHGPACAVDCFLIEVRLWKWACVVGHRLAWLSAAWGYWSRRSLDGVNCLELRVAAYSCRPEVAEASTRSPQKADAGRHRRRADGPQLERTHPLVIRLAAFAAADAGGPMPFASGRKRTPDPVILRAAHSAKPACRGVQQPLAHLLLARRVGVATRQATHPG
jgi:hypothetical protein